MRHRKKERNAMIYDLRVGDPEKWSFTEIGKIFNITKQAAHEAYHHELKYRQGYPQDKEI